MAYVLVWHGDDETMLVQVYFFFFLQSDARWRRNLAPLQTATATELLSSRTMEGPRRVVPPEELKQHKSWVALDGGLVYDLDAEATQRLLSAGTSVAPLIEAWGGRDCSSDPAAVAALAAAFTPSARAAAPVVGALAHEFTAAELAASHFVAFQGGVFDLAEFATTHPGGAELITDWNGKDGTEALLDAHPGGQVSKSGDRSCLPETRQYVFAAVLGVHTVFGSLRE
jgi:hypothetical protein